ncbi:putative GDP-L-fucose synthase 2 [Dichanthelium oligosanthes]|uniref:Putative GDP-L-fucose synthase 2 n=1 Tax=Dichanthelium oligosanthes TaxID=888268 RepID=A0A1E5UMF9_9POAL|nr:putative GDP-L-fucose synthase 2 [Dichanthelium oligosanthes]
MTENLRIITNVLTATRLCGAVRKLLFLATSAIYAMDAPQPIPETALLAGPPAPGNEWYAIPKIVGIKMCQAYRAELGIDAIVAAPNNLYGPREPFPSESSHVIPALIRRFHHAKATVAPEVVVWGSGHQLREFTHADDAADAIVLLMEKIVWDTSRAGGPMRRLVDSSKMRAMGWEPKVELRDGLKKLYEGYLRGCATDLKA